jgi:prophage regulatory protein
MPNDFAHDMLLRLDDAKRITGLQKTRIYDLIREQRFPKQVRIGRAARFSRNELDAWVDARKLERQVVSS